MYTWYVQVIRIHIIPNISLRKKTTKAMLDEYEDMNQVLSMNMMTKMMMRVVKLKKRIEQMKNEFITIM